jgi:hypothetical protein
MPLDWLRSLGSSHDTLEDCTMEGMNASGSIFFGEDPVVGWRVFGDNGQLGFGAHGPRFAVHRTLGRE